MFNTTSLSASDRESGHPFDPSVFKIVVIVWQQEEIALKIDETVGKGLHKGKVSNVLRGKLQLSSRCV